MPSDTTNDGAGGAPAGAADAQTEEAKEALPIYFSLQYIKDLSFENPRAPTIYESFEEPNVNIHVNVAANDLEDRVFEVSLKLGVNATASGESAFLAELEYAGLAHVDESVPEENVRPLVLIEGPRLLFPFARAIISNLTRDSAFPLLMLGPIDFVKMYRDSVRAQQTQANTA